MALPLGVAAAVYLSEYARDNLLTRLINLAIVNLGLLREYVGRPGNGMMPIRGHSGVQGGAEADMAAVRQELLNLSVDEAPGAETDDVNEGGKDFTTNNYWKTPYAPGLTPEELELLG